MSALSPSRFMDQRRKSKVLLESTLASGSIREVTLAAGRASVTLNQTCFVQVRPEVIDSLLANSMPEDGDLYSHVVVRPEDWNSIRPLCLEYVQSFVDTFYGR